MTERELGKNHELDLVARVRLRTFATALSRRQILLPWPARSTSPARVTQDISPQSRCRHDTGELRSSCMRSRRGGLRASRLQRHACSREQPPSDTVRQQASACGPAGSILPDYTLVGGSKVAPDCYGSPARPCPGGLLPPISIQQTACLCSAYHCALALINCGQPNWYLCTFLHYPYL
ncbi:unnamed protein product, partial [Pleuronectes platessa]